MRVIAEFGRPHEHRYHVEFYSTMHREWLPLSRHRFRWVAILHALIGTGRDMTRVVDTGVVA